jgi:hypothetical protein
MFETTKEIISMQTKTSKLASIAVATAVIATAFNLPAEAYSRHHHHYHHGYHSLTVRREAPVPVYAADPFRGPGVIVTAPVALAATFVSLPFRALGTVFPATGNTPLVIVGAPAHFAGQVLQFPFYVVGNAFGAAPATY